MRPSFTHLTCAETCPRSRSCNVSRSPMFGVCGKITIAPDGEILMRRMTCFRPRNSRTAVLDTAACRISARSSIDRLSVRGIMLPSRNKLDATCNRLPLTRRVNFSHARLRIGLRQSARKTAATVATHLSVAEQPFVEIAFTLGQLRFISAAAENGGEGRRSVGGVPKQ